MKFENFQEAYLHNMKNVYLNGLKKVMEEHI